MGKLSFRQRMKWALSIPFALLIAYLLLRRHAPEMTVLVLNYVPIFFTLLPLIGEMNTPPMPTTQKHSRNSSFMGLVLLETGDTELAMEKLRFVVEYVNRLYVTVQAKEIIS